MERREIDSVSDYIKIVKELTKNQTEIAREQSRLLNTLRENKNSSNSLSNYYQALFKEKDDIKKTYLALVKGRVFDAGKIDAKLEKNESKNIVFVSKSQNAKTALTLFEPQEVYKDSTLLKVNILTIFPALKLQV